jgi:diaminopimelate epimerase
MPLPSSDELTTDVAEGTLVQLDGIAQLVVTDRSKQETEEPRQLLMRLLQANEYSLADQPAVGVSYYNQLSGKAAFCVWVKAVDTIFDETACGSGTSAIGIAAATSSQSSAELPVVQPSGEVITTKVQYKAGRVTRSTIAGTVDILYDGEMRLP